VIGRDGKDCASALPAIPEVAATAIIAITILRIGTACSLSRSPRLSPAPIPSEGGTTSGCCLDRLYKGHSPQRSSEWPRAKSKCL
jgi:hypothetical protein